MVLAERKHLNIFDDDQLIVVFVEDCTIDEIAHILFIAFGEEHQGLGISLRRPADPLAVRVFTNALENYLYGAGQGLQSLFCFFGT